MKSNACQELLWVSMKLQSYATCRYKLKIQLISLNEWSENLFLTQEPSVKIRGCIWKFNVNIYLCIFSVMYFFRNSSKSVLPALRKSDLFCCCWITSVQWMFWLVCTWTKRQPQLWFKSFPFRGNDICKFKLESTTQGSGENVPIKMAL